MSSSVTCHLARGDGSRWIVTAYARDGGEATVCAVRELGPSDDDGGPSAGGGSRRNALWRTRLEEDDRLEWRDVDGRLVACRGAGPGETPEG